VLQRRVVEKCCGKVLEKSVVDKWRTEGLQKNVGEDCRADDVLQTSVGEGSVERGCGAYWEL